MRARWLKEPLLHFLVAGALLFAVHARLDDGSEPDAAGDRVVHVTAAQIDWLRQTWSRQRLRPPSEEELRGLISDHVKEELLAREAMELGLDRDDTIVRRRLAQKLEFLVRDTARLVEPTEDELRRLYAAEAHRYSTPPRVSFTQVHFDREADARASLENGVDPGEGSLSLLDADLNGADPPTVTNLFGAEFSRAVFALEPGGWHGPVPSAYGFHLVRVSRRAHARPRPFEEVRGSVLDDWHRQRQAEAHEIFLAALMEKYEVRMDEGIAPLVGPLAGRVR